MSGSIIRASAVLRRRVKGEDRTASGDGDDAYWAVAPRLYDFSKHEIKREQPAPPAPSPAPSPSPPPSRQPAPAPCLLTGLLQGGGVGWAVRKRVRYVGGQRAREGAGGGSDLHPDGPPPAAAVVESEAAVVVMTEEESSSNGKKRDRPDSEQEEADERGQDERKVATTEKRRKRKAGHGWRVTKRRRPKKTPPPEEVIAVADDSGQGEPKVVGKDEKSNRPEEEDENKDAAESGRDQSKVVRMEKKRNRPEEAEAEESGQDERKVVAVETLMKRNRKAGHGDKLPKKTRRVEAEGEVAGAPRAMVERWTGERYAAAEASLLGILRSHGARASQPIPRGKLRQEARKHIGDTGLLDHLLKHVAGKVTPGGAERIRRRHNADGAMEYWLEPAGLVALRREAGVEDPYWVPPPGWKPGDPGSPDACALQVKRQVEVLSSELAGVKRQMEQLMKAAHQGTLSKEMKSEICIADYQPYQEYDCMVKANGNLEKQVLSLEETYESVTRANVKLEEEVLFLKEKYEAVLEKNTRLEEQMADLCTSFLSLKEDLLLLNAGEQHKIDLCVEEDCKDDKQEGNSGGGSSENAAVRAGDQQLADAVDGMASSSGGTDARGAGGGSGKRTSRKCSMRIYKPQGTFQWPDAALALAQPSSPVTPTAGANLASMEDELHEYMMAGGLPPTPPSVSSTNAASAKLPLPLQPPPPPPSATSPGRDVLLALQAPRSGLELQLRRHTDTSSSSSSVPPCGATVSLPEGKKRVLALATSSY